MGFGLIKVVGKNMEFLQLNELQLSKYDNHYQRLKIIFERGGKRSTFPLWNMINGPISDIMYHSGQIVSFRRTNGNPLPKGVNVFTGRTKE